VTPLPCHPTCGTDTHRTILGDIDDRGTLHPRSGVEVRFVPRFRKTVLVCPACDRWVEWLGLVQVRAAA
jgi:hypothetical protein